MKIIEKMLYYKMKKWFTCFLGGFTVMVYGVANAGTVDSFYYLVTNKTALTGTLSFTVNPGTSEEKVTKCAIKNEASMQRCDAPNISGPVYPATPAKITFNSVPCQICDNNYSSGGMSYIYLYHSKSENAFVCTVNPTGC